MFFIEIWKIYQPLKDEKVCFYNKKIILRIHTKISIFLQTFINSPIFWLYIIIIFFYILDAAPIMTYRFIDQTLQPGPLVSLKCSARGSPTPTITWTLNGHEVPHNNNG